MPCMCWFDPSETSKKYIRDRCNEIIQEVKRLEKIGDPLDCTLKDVKTLLDHIYDPDSCTEKPHE